MIEEMRKILEDIELSAEKRVEIENCLADCIQLEQEQIETLLKLATTERELKETLLRQQLIMSCVADTITVYDKKLNQKSISDSIQILRGFSIAEALQQTIEQAFTPKSIQLIKKTLKEEMLLEETGDNPNPKRNRTLELQQYHKNGHIIWVEMTLSYIRNGKGTITGMISVTRDITKRKLIEKKAALDQTRLKNIITASPTGIHFYKTDSEGDLIFIGANPAADNILKIKHDELKGKTITEAFPGLSKTNIPERYKKIALHGMPWKSEQVNYEHGSIKGVFRVEAFRSEPERIVVMFDDITERKQAEEALKASRKMMREILDLIPVRVFWKDLDSVYLGCNKIFANDAGFNDPEDVIGKTDFQMYWRNQAETYRAYDKQVTKNDRSELLIEESQATPDGKIMEIITNKIPMHDPIGAVSGVLGTYVDITKIKQAEARNKKMQQQMENAVRMEAIGTLAGGIAHDFNNILTGIQGNISLALLLLPSTDPAFEKLRNTEECVKSAAALTAQLLGFARGGRYELRLGNMNETIQKSLEMFGRTKKELSLPCKLAPDLWNNKMDSGQIEQVLLNIFINAWQATPGGGSISVETGNVTLREKIGVNSLEPGPYVKVCITDTGMGMDEKTQSRIFEPFFTTKEMGRGTGLGLASAYGIIIGHNGAINVYSQPGQGTTFIIHLPALINAVVETHNDKNEPIKKGNENILLVDDEIVILDIAKALLTYLGYNVLTAKNGKDAIDIYRKDKNINLVILDMIMPDMQGGEVFDSLREIDPTITVLLSSGYSLDGQAQGIIERGCNGFIQKPFTIKELSLKVREVLDK
ncbi:MAG: PAS domain S-box protein [Candidatus Moraniibacteriota bacterium]